MTERVSDLVQQAYIAGRISKESISALKNREIASRLSDGLRRSDLRETDVLLVTVVIDDSGSISEAHQEPAIREGHNRLLLVLRTGASTAHTLVTTRFLNGALRNTFANVADACDLTDTNYDPTQFGGTPLYHQSVITLGTVMLQTQALEGLQCSVRTITLIMTDGVDESQYVTGRNTFKARYTTPASDVAFIVRDMERSGDHLVAAYAVGTGAALKSEFLKMGIKEGWILTSPNALQSLLTFANAAVRAGLSRASFQKLLAQGSFDG